LQAVYPKYGALHPNVLAKFILLVKIFREVERDSGCVFSLLKVHHLHGSLLKHAVDVNLAPIVAFTLPGLSRLVMG